MPVVDLIQPNTYTVRNNDVAQSVTNAFINGNGDLQMIWGYEKIEVDSFISKETQAYLITSNKKYLLTADIDGIQIATITNGEFIYTGEKYYFKVARKKGPDGKDVYGNGLPYQPSIDGISLKQDANGIIWATDGSIGGIYLLIIADSKEQETYFQQMDYGLFINEGAGYVKPFVNNLVVHAVSPVYLEFFNPNIVLIDNRKHSPYDSEPEIGYLYVIVEITVKDGLPVYDKARITQPFSMVNPIISAQLLNNMLYVISSDRIEIYRASSSNLPIEKVQSNALEIGCLSRNLLTTFNGKLIFVASSSDKRPTLNVWSGGERDPVEFNKNNFSYIFSYQTTNVKNLTLSAFATSTQEFVIINGFANDLSVLLDISDSQATSQNSFFIRDKGGFKADTIFQLNNEYYFISFDDNFIYKFSERYSTFDGLPINIEVKTMEYVAENVAQNALISNLNIILQPLPEDILNLYSTKYSPYLVDKYNVTFNVYYKSIIRGWLPLYEGRNFTINNITLGYILPIILQSAKRSQIKIVFHQRTYKYNNKFFYSPIIIKQLNTEMTIY